MRHPRSQTIGGLIGATLAAGAAIAQTAPNASLPAAYQQHVAAAKQAANGPAANMLELCDLSVPNRPILPTEPEKPVLPGKAFDNLYFVGLGSVSAWAITTSDGIILVDALNNGREVRDVLFPNMRKLGLDPAQIKYLIITHGHGDHYGGARAIIDAVRPKVVASAIDWELMEKPRTINNPMWDMPPARDVAIKDGDTITLGDTTMTLRVTPGHSPGTVSLLFPVTDSGRKHVAALWGGTAFNFQPEPDKYRAYGDSAFRFRDLARAAGADVILSNHSKYDGSMAALAALRTRRAGLANPFIIGADGVGAYLTVAGECARAREAVARAG